MKSIKDETRCDRHALNKIYERVCSSVKTKVEGDLDNPVYFIVFNKVKTPIRRKLLGVK